MKITNLFTNLGAFYQKQIQCRKQKESLSDVEVRMCTKYEQEKMHILNKEVHIGTRKTIVKAVALYQSTAVIETRLRKLILSPPHEMSKSKFARAST